MKRPIPLTVVGAVWILIGFAGMIGTAIGSHVLRVPSTEFVTVLVGIGLLSSWRLARWYALVASGLGFVLGLVCLPAVLWHANEWVFQFPLALTWDQRPHDPGSLPLLVAVLSGYMMGSGYTFWALCRADVRRLFAGERVTANALGT